jgi:hypothetical protein
MKYQCHTKIKCSMKDTFGTFRDYAHMPKWEKGLDRIEHVSGDINQRGSITNLIFTFGEEEMVMKETIEEIISPSKVSIIYEVPGAWNRCVNTFIDMGTETNWTMESEFAFDRENNTPINEFKKQTSKAMDTFRKYIEGKK